MAKPKGQGWHGDSEGHRKAGRKGGLARARNRRKAQTDISNIMPE